jgi:hypothetical protein
MKTDEDFGIICLCALRYFFGRRTYMPSLVTDFIKRNWKYISQRHKVLLYDNTRDAIKNYAADKDNPFYKLGDECDVNTYKCFFDWMKEQS